MKIAYIICILSPDTGEIIDTPGATFDRATAEEIALECAKEWLWRRWYYAVHSKDSSMNCGFVSSIYYYKLSDAPVEIRRIQWHG